MRTDASVGHARPGQSHPRPSDTVRPSRGAMLSLALLLGCGQPSPGQGTDSGADDGGGSGGDSDGDGGGGDPNAPTALVYGPTDLSNTDLLGALGMVVTVWDATEWRAATTEDFAAFDVIVVGEQSCAGPDQGGELGVLIDTGATWSAAVDGRVVVTGMDIACHVTDWEDTALGDSSMPPLLYSNIERWLAGGDGTAMSIATTWARRNTEPFAPLGEWAVVEQRGDNVVIDDLEHPVFDGIDQHGLDGWGSTYHSAFDAWPDDFDALAVGPDGKGVILARQ